MGLRASIFHFSPGHERDQDFYLDVGEYTAGATAWHARDFYLDLVVRTGRGVELADTDELMAAVDEGLISRREAEQAVLRAVAAVDGLARHDYDLHRWLDTQGFALTWAVGDQASAVPPESH